MNWLKRHWLTIALIGGIMLLVGYGCHRDQRWRELTVRQERDLYNQRAANDTLRTRLDTEGREVSEKLSLLVADFRELQGVNDSLYQLYASLDDELVTALIAAGFRYRGAPAEVPTHQEQLNDSTTELTWTYSYQDPGLTQHLAGRTRVTLTAADTLLAGPTLLERNDLEFTLTVGFTERGDSVQVFARPLSDKLGTVHLQGVTSYPLHDAYRPRRRWSAGPQLGATWNPGRGVVPFLGAGVTYNLLQFGPTVPR